MKHFIYLLAFAFMSVNASSQAIVDKKSVSEIGDIVISHNGPNLQITWSSNINDEDSYWEVQASSDGTQFNAIGIVFGGDPKKAGTYTFRQTANRIKKGYQFYRVAHIEHNNPAMASNPIRFSK